MLKVKGKTGMIVVLIVLFEVLGVLSAVHAVMSTRTPQGAIAWTVSLVFMPYVAVPAYWVFGRNKFQGYVLARQEDLMELSEAKRLVNATTTDLNVVREQQAPALRAAESLARLPVTDGNDATLLVDGDATFSSIFKGIAEAQRYILVQFYIVHNDQLGRELKKRLIERARQGIEVYFLYDEIGSHALPAAYIQEMRDAGIDATPFHSRKGAGNRFQLNFRNHRKIVITDGLVAWIGGHNVGDEYMGRSEKYPNWRDTHLRLEGPAVIAAQLSFLEDWYWATDENPDNWNWVPSRHPVSNKGALVIASGPADELETAALMFIHIINSATKRVWIASPYFVPDDAIIKAIQLAGMRGVDIKILIPDKADNLLVHLAAYSYLDDVKLTGARFYRYERGFLHQKVMLVDDRVSMIGTANFDNRSFRLNFEVSAFVVDEQFAQQMETMFTEDFSQARIMETGEFDAKPWWFRLAVRAARLAAPVL
jgi:cardiolipin synthase